MINQSSQAGRCESFAFVVDALFRDAEVSFRVPALLHLHHNTWSLRWDELQLQMHAQLAWCDVVCFACKARHKDPGNEVNK